MNDLTEQWKKGELPEGRYWVKIKTWCEYITMLYSSDTFLDGDVPVDNDKITEVLAPVPSYELWKAIHEQWKVLLEQNAMLEELLKECQHILKEQNFYRSTPIETDMIYRTRCLKKQELLTKIDEVLK